ncbi:MAG: hypothetical protein HY821_11730, partial [Acidobacteria bacterium]|nr:hypothetical protein [Acidobacteriota bacterium]
MLTPQAPPKPWFLSLIETLKDLSDFKKQAPLQVSFRPMTEEELLNSSDPSLRNLAELQQEKSFFQSFKENLTYLFRPPELPPLQVTSRPLSDAEMQGSALGEIGKAEVPWYSTLSKNIKEVFFPTKLPPLELTSRPVQVKELFGKDEYQGRSQFMSMAIHIGLVVLAFTVGSSKIVQNAVKSSVQLVAPDISPYVPEMQVKKQTMGGGGGGGDRSPLPASKGKLPRADLKQFTPP